MTSAAIRLEQFGPVQSLLREYEWFHTTVGICGNLAFVVGSVLFLFESLKTAGVWLFILGSFGMLIGALGRALVNRIEDERDSDRRGGPRPTDPPQ